MEPKRNLVDAAATDDPPSSSSSAIDDAAAAGATDDESKSDGTASSSSPPLLAFHQYKEDNMFMLSISDQILHKNLDHYNFLRQRENLYWSTPQGWMLIMEYPQPQEEEEEEAYASSAVAYLWDPRTGGKLPLPNIQEHHHALLLSKCLLTRKDPAHPGCVLVLLLRWFNAETAMWYCHIAAGAGWRRCSYDIHKDGLPISVVAACQGKLYFAGAGETMGAVDFSTINGGAPPVFQYFDVPRIRFPHGMCSANKWFVESNDQLFMVYIFFVDDWVGKLGTIRAYKMDFSAWVWRRVHDIGDAVIFCYRLHMGASCAATSVGLKPNQVYFANNYCNHDGAYLRAFDLGSDIMEDTWIPPQNSILRYLNPFWIVPPTNY